MLLGKDIPAIGVRNGGGERLSMENTRAVGTEGEGR